MIFTLLSILMMGYPLMYLCSPLHEPTNSSNAPATDRDARRRQPAVAAAEGRLPATGAPSDAHQVGNAGAARHDTAAQTGS